MIIQYPVESPEAVVQAAFSAFRNRDGQALAALASPDSLRSYVASVQSDIRPQWHYWTAEALRAHEPDMPIEAAQWQAMRMERDRAQHEERLVAQFDGVLTAAELEQMDAAELLTRALRAAPEQAIALGSCRVLGHVQDGEDRAYVLFWLAAEEEAALFEEPLVATVERVAGESVMPPEPARARSRRMTSTIEAVRMRHRSCAVRLNGRPTSTRETRALTA